MVTTTMQKIHVSVKAALANILKEELRAKGYEVGESHTRPDGLIEFDAIIGEPSYAG